MVPSTNIPTDTPRATWNSGLDFVLSSLGYAVGLGNIWRFPFYCGRNGGAAFFIPYLIMLIFAGIPMFYMELAIAQYSGKPPHQLYQSICPILGGLGFTMILNIVYTGIYYGMVIAWAIFYFVISFSAILPYSICSNPWNTPECFDQENFCNGTPNSSKLSCSNSDQVDRSNFSKNAPSAEFWNLRVLRRSKGIESLGLPLWDLSLCLFLSWLIVALILIKGIKTAGKTVYFTATFPYVIIFILVLRGLTLDGAADGLVFYLKPNLTRLSESQVWADAAVQIFFSLGIGTGGNPTLGSYNQFHHNILRDTLIVCIGNSLSSFIAGFAIFGVFGHLAKTTGQTMDEVTKGGPGLTFIAYPEALSKIKGSQLWSVLFFFMLILLGINTQQVHAEVPLTAIADQWPVLRQPRPRAALTFLVCFLLFLAGLVLATPGGVYVLTLVDKFAGGWPIILAGLCEVLMVTYIYGYNRLVENICAMLGKATSPLMKFYGYPINKYWLLNWRFITPGFIGAVLLFSWIQFEPLSYDSYVYPQRFQLIGWVISFTSLIPLIYYAAYALITAWICQKPIKKLFIPTENWTPNDPILRSQRAFVIEECLGRPERTIRSPLPSSISVPNEILHSSLSGHVSLHFREI